MTGHKVVNAPDLAEPKGFAHAVVASPGTPVYLGGQTALDRAGEIVGETMAEQFAVAAGNVSSALAAAGSKPEDLVSLIIYVTDIAEYKTSLDEIGRSYREVFGKHFPAIALIGVRELFDEEAKIELVATAVIPEEAG